MGQAKPDSWYHPRNPEFCAELGAMVMRLVEIGQANLLAAKLQSLEPAELGEAFTYLMTCHKKLDVDNETGRFQLLLDGKPYLTFHVYDAIAASRWDAAMLNSKALVRDARARAGRGTAPRGEVSSDYERALPRRRESMVKASALLAPAAQQSPCGGVGLGARERDVSEAGGRMTAISSLDETMWHNLRMMAEEVSLAWASVRE